MALAQLRLTKLVRQLFNASTYTRIWFLKTAFIFIVAFAFMFSSLPHRYRYPHVYL